MLFLILFLGIILLGGCSGIAYWQIHIATVVFSLLQLHKVSKYFLFWILAAFCFFFAQEPRFSLEYFFLAAGFLAWGMSNWWLHLEDSKKKIFFIWSFLVICVFHFIGIEYSEHGSLLLWLPVFLALYYPWSKSNLWLYSLSGIFLAFSAKVIAFLAYLTVLLSKFQKQFLFFLVPLVIALSFSNLSNLNNFFEKSINSRLSIWQSCFTAFTHEPLTGFGFGTFPLDFSTNRITADIWGARADQFVAHGHSMFFHYLFEMGIWGALLFITLLIVVYQKAKPAFLPFLLVSLFDASLVSFSQILLASLILSPFLLKNFNSINWQFKGWLAKITAILALVLSLYIQIPSLVGHYFFDHKNLNQAIHWDKKNSLYYLVRGIDYLNIDTQQSEKDFRTAIMLTPNIGFYYGYLAAAELANGKIAEAKISIDKAIKNSGGNAYWHLIAALIYKEDSKLYQEHLRIAFKEMPKLKKILRQADKEPELFIGGKGNDLKTIGFYRKGEDLPLPLPYLPLGSR